METSVNRVWFKWPENYFDSRPNLAPWYVIVRRLAFLPIIILGASLLWIGVACGYGFSEAERLRKDIM